MHTRIDTDTVYAQHAQPAFNVIRIRRLHLLAFVQYILEKEKKKKTLHTKREKAPWAKNGSNIRISCSRSHMKCIYDL